MENIKFLCINDREKQFAKAVRQNVNDYFVLNGISKKGNIWVVVQSIFMISLYLVPFILILTVPMAGWAAWLMAILSGLGVAGVGMCVMHDAIHGSYSDKPWVNQMFSWTMYLLGSNVLTWKVQHNVLHHTYTNISGMDADIASRGPMRFTEDSPLGKKHKYQYIHAFMLYGLMSLSRIVRDFTMLFEYRDRGLLDSKTSLRKELAKMIGIKAVYVALFIVLPILITPFAWWQVLIGFFTMHWVAGIIMTTIFQLAHVVEGTTYPLPDSKGCIESEWMVHELETTANFGRNNTILNWCVGGLNFQIEHHLFPHICHVHYPKISTIVERTAHEYGFKYNIQPTFRSALMSHVDRLKTLGMQPLEAMDGL